MIAAVLSGRVGNQLFQYAFARAQAVRLNTSVEGVCEFDDGFGGRHLFQLGLFKIPDMPLRMDRPEPVVSYQGMDYRPDVVKQVFDPCTILGYWQSEKYFLEIESLIRAEIQPRNPPSIFTENLDHQILAQGNKSVALSVRRGDYFKHPFHGVLPVDYYAKAIELIASKVSDPYFFLFSDDPEWLRREFNIPYRSTIAGNLEPTTACGCGREDSQLQSMSLCQHAILANSSFSWWGAWLGDNKPNRIVIVPEHWYLGAKHLNTQDLIPERWTKI